MSTTLSDIEIKGFAIRGLLRYAKQTLPGGIPSLLDSLEPTDKELFSDSVLSTSWYSYRTFTALIDGLIRAKGGSPTKMFEVGEFSGTQDAGTIFRIVMTLSSVKRVIGACPRFWKRYSTAGDFELLSIEDGKVDVALVGFPEIHLGHCELAAGWMKGLGESAGAKNAAVKQTRCVHRGDQRCEFVATWS
jgi:predicted hydrocarbon binding protein